jgi:hypothetical protein
LSKREQGVLGGNIRKQEEAKGRKRDREIKMKQHGARERKRNETGVRGSCGNRKELQKVFRGIKWD